jgi:putative phosphoribosyl transferase
MMFASRQQAGRKLGQELLSRQLQPDIVLGLPRGGVVVAGEVAKILKRPLDVLVVRKIGHPRFREFAVGALAEGEVVVLDELVLERARLDPDQLNAVIAEESQRLSDYRARFARAQRAGLESQTIILVDDGLATGATAEAAVQSARKQGAGKIIIAVPVASQSGWERLTKVSDQVIALVVDPSFEAVGQYYRSFPQTSDEEVIEVLANES